MIDALNMLSTKQWVLLTAGVMLVLTTLLIWVIWPSRDVWDSPVWSGMFVGMMGGLVLVGIVWGGAWLVDGIIWMWQN